MSWMQKLVETYHKCASLVGDYSEKTPLIPIFHTLQNAHIHVSVNERSELVRAEIVEENNRTIIPATEESAGRTSGYTPHPLFDKLQYVAKDYAKLGGDKRCKEQNTKKEIECFYLYSKLLNDWCESEHGHHKVQIVLSYLLKGTLIQDLMSHSIIVPDEAGMPYRKWPKAKSPIPSIYRILPPNSADQLEAFVRFSVEIPEDPIAHLWEDRSVWESWIAYYRQIRVERGQCYVTGNVELLAEQHPARIRHAADGAKLISSNDKEGFTYRGRFTDAEQACSVGIETSHKAHAALRWLIARQGGRNGELATVAWAVGRETSAPNPLYDTAKLFKSSPNAEVGASKPYTAQEFGRKFRLLVQGYGASLGATDDIVVMALNAASTGRLAIKFYRELTGSEFLERLEAWHTGCAWPWKIDADEKRLYICAPSPKDIARAAYGRSILGKAGGKLLEATVERLLPCIVDGAPLPRDLTEACCRRACNRAGFEKQAGGTTRKGGKPTEQAMTWHETLGVACATYRYFHKEENYQMALEHDRRNRDYLYGRLLSLADYLEGAALNAAGEKRETNAARYTQRFADHPFSTWRTIDLNLRPYRSRLSTNKRPLLTKLEKSFDEVMCLFSTEDFTSDERLSGEFLIGYYCQRAELFRSKEAAVDTLLDELQAPDADVPEDENSEEE
ncbi:type I-C CRISPR-associated protein Cas8c/Csd1 [Desulfocurvibacter africanus]|uniref:type I-C CRISPR-associated protein Cas8c/Csd1 n=1 Tax=Desulfocurvibacter africanus TaxID=873 RepID=UPI000423620B|nr:type I-C CRISPR-associated protein Cas8c/Csd1 [Desulfocurvibacter africanus]